MRFLSSRLVIGALALASVALFPFYAEAGETIYACAHKNSGDLRLVSAPGQCLKSEYELSWEGGQDQQQNPGHAIADCGNI